MTASMRSAPAAIICARKSGPVSMTTRVVPSGETRSASAAQRVRAFFGFDGSQLPQSPLMRGVPGEEPQPRMVKRNRSAMRSGLRRPRHFGEKPEEVVGGNAGDLLLRHTDRFGEHGGRV